MGPGPSAWARPTYTVPHAGANVPSSSTAPIQPGYDPSVTHDSALDDDNLGFDEFRLHEYFTSPDVIRASQLPDAPLHGTQQTQVAAGGSSQMAGEAQTVAGTSQVPMATPPPDDDRRWTIRPRDPLTYDQDHTKAGA